LLCHMPNLLIIFVLDSAEAAARQHVNASHSCTSGLNNTYG
jgi:hypothetical protein